MNVVFRAVLAFTLLVSTTVEAGGHVSIWMDNVKLKCPQSGTWSQLKPSNVQSFKTGPETHEYPYKGSTDQYYCQYKDSNDEDKKYHFYIQGKTCQNCIELEAWVFAVVIVADVIGTAVIMAIVYKCTKKTSGGPQKPSQAARSREVDIPLTYEPLSAHTRSQETYSVINKTG